MSENWQIFTPQEIKTISFECPECHTLVMFHGDSGVAIGNEKFCPGCNKEIPNAVAILSAYRKFYQEATREGQKAPVTLRAKTSREPGV
jgi:hypothetical protein